MQRIWRTSCCCIVVLVGLLIGLGLLAPSPGFAQITGPYRISSPNATAPIFGNDLNRSTTDPLRVTLHVMTAPSPLKPEKRQLLDLVVPNGNVFPPVGQNQFSILLGNGDGTFQPFKKGGDTGNIPTRIAVGDFNRDRFLDVVTLNEDNFLSPAGEDGTCSVFLGNGDGTFGPSGNGAPKTTFSTHISNGFGSAPSVVVVGDFNGDGKLDLAIGGTWNPRDPRFSGPPDFFNARVGKVAVFLGNGDGTFSFKANPGSTDGTGLYTVGTDVQGIAVGALRSGGGGGDENRGNHDDQNGQSKRGKLDIVVTARQSDLGVWVLLGNGDGTFQAPYGIMPDPDNPFGIGLADINEDGRLDVLVTDSDTVNHQVKVLLGNGDGTFQPERAFPNIGRGNSLAIGDFNRDGHLDLAVSNGDSGAPDGVSVLLGDGNGNLGSPAYYPTSFAYGIQAADFNGDRILDLVINTDLGEVVLLGTGDANGTFVENPVPFPANVPSADVAVGQFRGKLKKAQEHSGEEHDD